MSEVTMADYKTINQANTFSQEKLQQIRAVLALALKDSPSKEKITVITTGSYGRAEASDESDLDLFILFDSDLSAEDTIREELKIIKQVVNDQVPNSVGDSGTFGADAVINFRELVTNIGGDQDDNKSLTRRMLFLLEAVYLYGDDRFKDYQKRLLEKYILPTSPQSQASKFLLNDIIRYYRTMATDFEFKVSEQKKEWGLRNIKLRFSRKLIYFGGLMVSAELVGLNREERIKKAVDLFSQPVLIRLCGLDLGVGKAHGILSHYEAFLERISNHDVRQKLGRLEKADRESNDEFKALRDRGIEFSKALDSWLKAKYPSDHVIHHSLVF